MTKQELYDLAITKFDKVTPVNEWKLIGSPVLGVARYSVQVYKDGSSPKTYTVFVDDDGGAGENAFVEGNPFVTTQPVETFEQKVNAFISTAISNGTIVDAITDMQGANVRESYVYRDVNNTLVREKYLINLDSNGDIQFRKIG